MELVHTSGEACEQRYAEYIQSSKERATAITIVIVSLQSLPASVGNDFACLEEPIPLEDYRRSGLTTPELVDVFDDLRATWKHSYLDWHRERLKGVLSRLVEFQPDLVVFPRFSLPFELGRDVVEWCQQHECNASIGGYSFLYTADVEARYQESPGISISAELPAIGNPVDVVIDVTIRHDRAGRYLFSHITGPFARSETLVNDPRLIQLSCKTGWISTAVICSSKALQAFVKSRQEPPELLTCVCGIHADNVESIAQQ